MRLKSFIAATLALGLCLFVSESYTSAQTLINESGIEISEEEYSNLLSIGFTSDEIQNMGQEAYELNKGIKGEVVGSETQYLKIIELPENQYLRSNSTGNFEPLIIQLDKETYEKEVSNASNQTSNDNGITPYDITETSKTSYKTMNTVIARLGVQNYRLKQSIIWHIMPSNRKIDVSGIGINGAFWGPTPNSNYGEQTWTTYSILNGTQSHSAIYNASSTSWHKGPGGYAVKIDLPDDDFGGGAGHKDVETLQSYMYYGVTPMVANNRLDAYGQYAHQETLFTISPAIALSGLSFSISQTSDFSYHPNTHVLKTNP